MTEGHGSGLRPGRLAAVADIRTRDVVGSVLLAGSLAVAQPVLDLLSRNVEFFVNRQSPPVDIVLLGVVLALLLPAVLAFPVAALLRLSRPVGLIAHAIMFTGLVATLTFQVVERMVALRLVVLALIGGIAGLFALLAFYRLRTLRTTMRWGTAVPVLVLAMFLVVSPTTRLILPAQAAEATARSVDNPVPVVVLILDALPVSALMESDATIDEELFPNFARLADGSTWYRNTTTVHSWTHMVTPVLLTGTPRDPEAQPQSSFYPDNLFTLFDSGGYDVHASEQVSWLCPLKVCPRQAEQTSFGSRFATLLHDVRIVTLHVVLPNRLTQMLPPIDQGWGGFGEDADPDIARPTMPFPRWLETFEEGAQSLYYHHLWLPHYPFVWTPEGYKYHDPLDTPGGPDHGEKRWHDDDWYLAQAYSRMMLQVGHTDTLVGQFLDRLETSGIYDDALVVVMSDHGVSFAPGSLLRQATPENLDEIAYVPMFIKEPGQTRGDVDDRPVSLVDVVPSIADAIGIQDMWETDGLSVFADITEDRVRELSTDQTYRLSPQAEIDAALQRKTAWFGEDGGWERFFRFGEYGDLVGSSPQQLTAAADTASSVSVTIDERDEYGSVDLASDSIPALVTGRLRGLESDEPVYLAVALNGEIAAIGKSFELRGSRARFAAMLPSDAFVDGANDLAVYEIADTDTGSNLRLLPEG